MTLLLMTLRIITLLNDFTYKTLIIMTLHILTLIIIASKLMTS